MFDPGELQPGKMDFIDRYCERRGPGLLAEPFNAVYEQTCLCALDPDDWQAYETRLARWLVAHHHTLNFALNFILMRHKRRAKA